MCLSLVSFCPVSLKNFEVEADDLVAISELGRGAYGVVEKVRHAQSGTIMAVKVRTPGWDGHQQGQLPGSRGAAELHWLWHNGDYLGLAACGVPGVVWSVRGLC